MGFNSRTIATLAKTIFLSTIVGLSIFGLFYFIKVATKPPPIIQSFVPLPVPTTTISLEKQQPTSIHIPAIKKNLPIQAALVKDNEWDMFDSSVAWLSTSSVPGEGNVILYAHNWKNLWADLYKLVPGDEIEVDQNGKKTMYVVYESRAVKPTDVDVILSDANQLTLYTCEGSFDQKRRVVFAEPK
jgi:LPXTG-site transpeptidase (sortase) family protein